MGFVDFISGIFKPKEVRLALREGHDAIHKGEEAARKNAVSAKEFHQMMKDGSRQVETERMNLQIASREAKKEVAELKKLPQKMTQPDLENYFFGKGYYLSHKEVERVAAVSTKFNDMEFDRLERQGQNAAKMISEIKGNLVEAEKVAAKVTQMMVAQRAAIDRLAKIFDEKDAFARELNQIAENKRMIAPDRKVLKREAELTVMMERKDREIIGAFQNVATYAVQNSQLRQNIDFLLQLLAPIKMSANDLNLRVKDEIEYAELLLTLENNISSWVQFGMRSETLEAEKLRLVSDILRNAAA
jgi:hypothetical protein